MEKKKVLVFGIDGAPPELVFDKWRNDLPTINNLMQQGCYAKLNSTIPPSTIIAWTSMFSGKNPAEFDIYSYTIEDNEKNRLVNSQDVKTDLLWHLLSQKNKKSIVLNVPLTYPIIKEFNGYGAGDFLSPAINEKSLYPKELHELITEKFPRYAFDVSVGLASYKNLGKKEMIEKIYEMTESQIGVLHYLLKNKAWDLAIWVCIGTDRLQHTMWSYIDEKHNDFKGESEFKNSLFDYYKYLDAKLAETIKLCDKETTIIVASDHGFNRMDGRVNLNDWLRNNGYLVMKENIDAPQKFDMKDVDWQKTKAYAVGAYFGRIFFNKKSRSEHGILTDEESLQLQEEIILKLKNFQKPNGEKMNMVFHKPQNVYEGKYLEKSPDVYVYFDNLIWGVNNDVGNVGLYSTLTLLGSDDGGHAPTGIFIMSGNNVRTKGDIGEINIVDVMPTILNKLNIQRTNERGRAIL